jgi:hypothetical protein
MLCNDEKAYRVYMAYLDEMERQGQWADPDKAMDAALDALEKAAAETARATNGSPFFCDPVDNK